MWPRQRMYGILFGTLNKPKALHMHFVLSCYLLLRLHTIQYKYIIHKAMPIMRVLDPNVIVYLEFVDM